MDSIRWAIARCSFSSTTASIRQDRTATEIEPGASTIQSSPLRHRGRQSSGDAPTGEAATSGKSASVSRKGSRSLASMPSCARAISLNRARADRSVKSAGEGSLTLATGVSGPSDQTSCSARSSRASPSLNSASARAMGPAVSEPGSTSNAETMRSVKAAD